MAIDMAYNRVVVNNNGWMDLYRDADQLMASVIVHERTQPYNEYLRELETAGWQLVDYLPDGDGAVYEREVAIVSPEPDQTDLINGYVDNSLAANWWYEHAFDPKVIGLRGQMAISRGHFYDVRAIAAKNQLTQDNRWVAEDKYALRRQFSRNAI